MQRGEIKAFDLYNDVSYQKEGVLSCCVTILYRDFWGRQRLRDFYKYGYYGESLKKGDKVIFEIDYADRLAGLAKDDEG